tara:strand:+ start:1588 stop:1800 length:213 start_codon:yes stop_codon:yes gene_type:complete
MIGRKIKNIRLLTDKELKDNYWDDSDERSAVIELDDGTILYASQDYEGNGPGAIFGTNKNGKDMFVVYPE